MSSGMNDVLYVKLKKHLVNEVLSIYFLNKKTKNLTKHASLKTRHAGLETKLTHQGF